MQNAVGLATRDWYGYGRWDAPYWFVGPEPGGQDADAPYEAWLDRFGGAELIDCRDHHRAANELRPQGPQTLWHDAAAPRLQPTWSRLIRLLLSYQGVNELQITNATIGEYQREQWGNVQGETAVLEISSLHAPGFHVHVQRRQFLDHRIETLHTRLDEHRPTFIVFYGGGRRYKRYYERVIAANFDEDGYARYRRTLCSFIPHPVSRTVAPGVANTLAWWMQKGFELRDRSNPIK